MPLKCYSVLKGRARAKHASKQGHPHYHILVEAGGESYRAAVNVRSMLHPAEMAYVLKLRFRHPICQHLHRLESGLHPLPCEPGGMSLDYIRQNLFQRDQVLVLPCSEPECGPDLNSVLDGIVGAAIVDPDAYIYVFGEPWSAEAPDRIFRFQPSRGMHEVHMNQGNDPCHWTQDGVWQDGGLLIEHPTHHRWTAVFLKFQSQSWHTDDKTGHALTPPNGKPYIPKDANGHHRPDGMLRIVAAVVNPFHENHQPQRVTLLNCCPFPVSLDDWHLADHLKRRWRLHGEIEPGRTVDIPLGASISLGKEGGIITLLDEHGYKIHGVSYTAEQAAHEGWTITF